MSRKFTVFTATYVLRGDAMKEQAIILAVTLLFTFGSFICGVHYGRKKALEECKQDKAVASPVEKEETVKLRLKLF